ncbi:SpoVR family protein [Paraliobacillus salinarum]|uniref:SpoVR family protein n=1 Tax=Paraliobacillus salinarum TaxID=1158996 RepID=UPI0015F6308E|nr:SpoVR family protein [Paraliobacillus salinarum]
MKRSDLNQLKRSIEEITEIAKGFGLDFFSMRYEICPPDILYTFGAYGMPTRFSHWSFGKQFELMKLQNDLGLSKIYELVINSDPCYAFLLHSNSLIQNKLIVAHVLAHSDFFKNNLYFSRTRKDMNDYMSFAADRIDSYEKQFGKQQVEAFLDAVLSIQDQIDTNQRDHDDLKEDLLLFIGIYSENLQEWQRDIITMLREEMLYFWPQLETKIINEGWATFWHQRIMRELELETEEVIEFAKLHAAILKTSKTKINPYHIGVKLFEDIEKRFDYPTEYMRKAGISPFSGQEKIFEVREIENDVSFFRNYLSEELIARENLYVYRKQEKEYKIIHTDGADVKNQLIKNLINGGVPYLTVHSGDYLNNGELYLVHHYEGMELDIYQLERTLPYIYQLWGKNVYVETIIENKSMIFMFNGTRVIKKEKSA